MSRRILPVDMDAFFAAVALKRHPELRGKPVVIGGRGDPTQRGVVSTASYAARRFGIHSAMPLRTAYRLCPETVFWPVDFAAYQRESAAIKTLLQEITPRMEDVGIDEAFLDLTELEESSAALAARILAATGLTCSIGIAPNQLLAKREAFPMRILREVWVEFGDGSVAKYRVQGEDVRALLDQLVMAGISRRIWVDGRLWTPDAGPEGPDPPAPGQP